MTNRTWNGASADFTTAADWLPNGVPQSGDVATISAGTVFVNGLTLSGLQTFVQSSSSAGGTLQLVDATSVAGSAITLNNPNTYGTGVAPSLVVQGRVVNSGSLTLSGTVSNISFLTDSNGVAGSLVNTGTITISGASPQINTAGNSTAVFENDGSINVTNSSSSNFESPVTNVFVSGTGTINLATNSKLDLRQGVSAGQQIVFGGVGASDVLQIENVNRFAGTLGNFVNGNTILVANTPYDGATYTSTSASSGTLSLFSGGALQGSIKLAGVYSLSNFTFSYTNLGSGSSNLVIQTNVANAATGQTVSTATGTPGTPGGPGAPGAVYRFFDTKFGTHFFTSDLGEKNTVIATRPDLVEETNGFGDVAPTDSSAVAVYRFFDTNFGTHFFTASASERDTVLATRPDLTYEANSTFYEHSTQQTGDTAVYRLFDQKTGTQFLTGDQGEYNGITTPGSATYRADLRSEGVAFYAPTGSFT